MPAPSWRGPSYPGEFPSLGWVGADWIEQHCVIPDGFHQDEPYVLTDEQLSFLVNHYRLKPSAKVGQLAPAFHYRRSQLVRPQKWGKGPLTAAQVCLEGVGPALFAGWAAGGERWDCRDHGCGCGWVHEYEPGEPMGMAWPTPLVQITATSEEQTDNIYGALRPMIDRGPLHELIPKTGEEFIRLPGSGRIDVVTSSARSRLGQRVTFVPQDETGLWTPQSGMVKVAETQRRGLAGMGGRAVETTNGWDLAENSVAQRTAESKRPDIYRDHRLAPEHLRYRIKAERQKIHRHVYGDSWWVDLDAIEAEAAELLELDAAQAERFFGNRIRSAEDAAFDGERWKSKLVRPDYMPAPGALVVAGVDGARYDDAVAIIATEVPTGFQWPVGIWERPPGADELYEHPMAEIDAAMVGFWDTYQVWRAYIDPQYIDHLVDLWAGRWGSKIVAWTTNRPKPMAYALRSYRQAMTSGDVTHNGDETFAAHIGNARRRPVNVYDDQHRRMWGIQKETPARKIDAAAAGTISWEARGDAIAAGVEALPPAPSVFV
jgi:hypothetical protein